jgi:DNA-binding transcriptional ArsR family regulator
VARAPRPPTPPSPPTGSVVLTDAAAVKALAHPARLAVIDALYAGDVLTATQCAAVAGITPSAMSYHLRALEKHGIVRRAEPGSDGRERPWMRAGDSLRTELRGDGASDLAVAGLLMDEALNLDRERLRRAIEADVPGGDSRGSTYEREQLILTVEESRELVAEIDKVTERYKPDTRRGKAPEGASVYYFSLLLARDPGP